MRESTCRLWDERPDGLPRALVLTRDHALLSWLVASVLEPLNLDWRVEAEPPGQPRAAVAICALGPVQAREREARRLAGLWSIPVVVLLGRGLKDPCAPEACGVLPVCWPHAPSQVQQALLRALGVDPSALSLKPPGAPRILRVEEHREGFGN